ncbi:hypothetical protein VKT23_018268 [Stygiomarasmius scandens]|uniref:Fungal N-terminal domain-containing protein n=1 Tax=Marasmiellus scandens TaxID=2682957 RepID=A0ABR1ITB5_9AGAR
MAPLTLAAVAAQVAELTNEIEDLQDLINKKRTPKSIESLLRPLVTRLANFTVPEVNQISQNDSAHSCFAKALSVIRDATRVDGVGHIANLKAAREVCKTVVKTGDTRLKFKKKTATQDIEDLPDDDSDDGNACGNCTQAHPKASCPVKFKGKKSTVPDNQKANPSVEIVIDGDVNMEENTSKSVKGPEVRASTVSISYSEVPGMDTTAWTYIRAQKILEQSLGAPRPNNKRIRGPESVDIRTPSATDVERSSGSYPRRLVEEVSLLPFSELSSKSSDSLKALANLLLVYCEQSLFATHRSLTEYKTAQEQRAEVLRILLERAVITSEAVEVPVAFPGVEDADSGSQGQSSLP